MNDKVFYTVGGQILLRAMKEPFRKLMENSGFDYSEIRESMSGKRYPFGIDVFDGKIKDLIKSGVIDPVKVIRSSLENATSIACLVITTETLVAFKPQKQ
jgi:chaperonin GroEL